MAVDPVTGYVYLTEDNGPTSGFYRYRPHNRSRRLGALEEGGVLEMLKVVGDYRGQEFAGATFSPFGRTLFVNIQTPRITFAIEGPWWRGSL